jgi:hypothetical protein
MRTINISLSVLVLFCGGASAADATLEAARRCVQLTDSLQRLVCFDRAFAAAPAQEQVATPVAPMAAAPAIAPVAVVAPSLGDENLKRARDPAAQAEPKSLTAKVAALRETRKDVFRITLDNGQVWQQMDLESMFYLKVGDLVQVDKGLMGGYRMAKTGNSRSGWARVTRIK